jgi:branched-chain amino acid transport system substrate-binding protein
LSVVAVMLIAVGVIAAAPSAAADRVVKVAYIDPLSGPFANVGELGLKTFQFVIQDINRRQLAGNYRFELVPYDNKGTPQETMNALRSAADAGVRIVTQGNGSGVALAIVDAITKQYERDPNHAMLYLNYAAVDPDLTNSKCSFWHFRFDANSEMKLMVLSDFMKSRPEIKKVYLLNQNYAHGVQVSRAAKTFLAQKRPDVEIVGDDLHPLGQVKDFAPYVAKIKSSGADTVITGNWGNDMSLLIKAANDAGLRVQFYTFYAGGIGSPTAMGDAAAGAVKQVTEWHANLSPNKTVEWAHEFRAKTGLDFYYLRINNEMYMLAEAIRRTQSDDPVDIAYALEGLRWTGDTGDIEMRPTDHQLLQPLFISTARKVAARGGPKEVTYELENSGLGFQTDARMEPYVSALPTTCQMKRPARRQASR